MNLLLVEKDPSILRLLQRYAEQHRYGLDAVRNGRQAMALCADFSPDLILQGGRSLSTKSGHLVRQLRDERDIPSILLVAEGKVDKFASYVRTDFDDFLTTPFDISELMVRIGTVLSRKQRPVELIECGPLLLDVAGKRIQVSGVPLDLTPMHYRFLSTLVEAQGRVLSSEELIQRVWPDSSRANCSDVQQCIHQLRRKLESAGLHAHSIQNQKGFGYRLVCGGSSSSALPVNSLRPPPQSQRPSSVNRQRVASQQTICADPAAAHTVA